jgi:putative hemolysin
LSELWTKFALVLLFILISSLFVTAEIALVSLRESQIQQLASRGRRGRVVANLMKDPNRFLAAAQVGITFTSFIGAGLGASEIAPLVAPLLVERGMRVETATTVSFLIVTLIVAYVSLVLGELTPKRLAIQKPEGLALTFAYPVEFIARAATPFIWLLSRSTNAVLRLFGVDPHAGRESITGEELRDIVAAHEELSDEERSLIDEVFEAQDRELREVMQPRTEVDFLDGEMPVRKAVKLISEMPHSRYPVIGDSVDDVLGFVHIRDILNPEMAERSIRLADLVREIPRFPGTKHVIPTLSEMRRAKVHFAIVEDEYGGTAGIVTLEDLVEELVGDIRDEYDEESVSANGNELVVDGVTNLEDIAELIDLELPEGPYETVAGFIMAEIGELPEIDQTVEVLGHRLTVLEVENRRATKVKIEVLPEAETDSE